MIYLEFAKWITYTLIILIFNILVSQFVSKKVNKERISKTWLISNVLLALAIVAIWVLIVIGIGEM